MREEKAAGRFQRCSELARRGETDSAQPAEMRPALWAVRGAEDPTCTSECTAQGWAAQVQLPLLEHHSQLPTAATHMQNVPEATVSVTTKSVFTFISRSAIPLPPETELASGHTSEFLKHCFLSKATQKCWPRPGSGVAGVPALGIPLLSHGTSHLSLSLTCPPSLTIAPAQKNPGKATRGQRKRLQIICHCVPFL